MSLPNAWRKQTAWLSDKTYRSERQGIWTDRVTKADRRCQVTDREVDGLRRRDTYLMAVDLVDYILRRMGPDRAKQVGSATKWAAVDLVEAKQIEAAALLLAGKV